MCVRVWPAGCRSSIDTAAATAAGAGRVGLGIIGETDELHHVVSDVDVAVQGGTKEVAVGKCCKLWLFSIATGGTNLQYTSETVWQGAGGGGGFEGVLICCLP